MQQHPPSQPPPVGRVVAVPDGHAGQRAEQDPEEEVHHSELERFAAFGASGDAEPLTNRGCFEQRIEQAGQILGAVFTVGVHRHDEVDVVDVGFDHAEAEDDRPLVAQVERRHDHGDVVEGLQRLDLGVETAGVVDQDESDGSGLMWG